MRGLALFGKLSSHAALWGVWESKGKLSHILKRVLSLISAGCVCVLSFCLPGQSLNNAWSPSAGRSRYHFGLCSCSSHTPAFHFTLHYVGCHNLICSKQCTVRRCLHMHKIDGEQTANHIARGDRVTHVSPAIPLLWTCFCRREYYTENQITGSGFVNDWYNATACRKNDCEMFYSWGVR